VSPTPSPSARPSRRSAPSPSPRPSSSGSPAPTPVTYRVPKGLCKFVDLAPVNELSSPPAKPSVSSDHFHYAASGDDLYTCHGVSGMVLIHNIEVMIYPTATLAGAAYTQDKAFSDANIEPIPGIGTDAYGYLFDPTTYVVQAFDGNLTFKIVLYPSTKAPAGKAPPPDRLRPAAIAIAGSTIPKLRA
jgi:hypothetical protein